MNFIPLSTSTRSSSLHPGPAALPAQLPLPVDPAAPSTSFSDLLTGTIADAARSEMHAQQSVQRALTGEDVTQAEVLASVKKADLSVRMLLQIRNKLLDAYNEIQQMRF